MAIVVAQRDLYGDRTSDVTSQEYWIGDAETATFQLKGGTSASTTTVQFSNAIKATGTAEALWSTDTTVIGEGMFALQEGAGWIRMLSDVTIAILEIKNGHY